MIFYMTVSLDGFVAGPNDEVDRLFIRWYFARQYGDLHRGIADAKSYGPARVVGRYPLSSRGSVPGSPRSAQTAAPGYYDAVIAACRDAGFGPRLDEQAAGSTVWATSPRSRRRPGRQVGPLP